MSCVCCVVLCVVCVSKINWKSSGIIASRIDCLGK